MLSIYRVGDSGGQRTIKELTSILESAHREGEGAVCHPSGADSKVDVDFQVPTGREILAKTGRTSFNASLVFDIWTRGAKCPVSIHKQHSARSVHDDDDLIDDCAKKDASRNWIYPTQGSVVHYFP